MKFHQLILIGILIVFLDINLGNFDIIHDAIGYILILQAFRKVNHPYSKYGIISSVILLATSIYFIFIPTIISNNGLIAYSFSKELFNIIVSLVNIINIYCIFAVSSALLNIEKSKFPAVFISALLIFELVRATSFFNGTITSNSFMALFGIILFILYIIFIVLIWKRKKLEDALYTIAPAPSETATNIQA